MGCSAVDMPINTYLCNRFANAKIENYVESVCFLPDYHRLFSAFAKREIDFQEGRTVCEDACEPIESHERQGSDVCAESGLRNEAQEKKCGEGMSGQEHTIYYLDIKHTYNIK